VIIDLALHSFSLWHHFRNVPGFGPIQYIDACEELGFTGINLSLNDANFRHLGGRETWRMDEVRKRLERSGLSLEIDTSDTNPAHMLHMIDVAHRMGAKSMRFYTRHHGEPEEMVRKTLADLYQIVDHAQRNDVILALENHEDFTGPELAAMVRTVNHPNLRILYDYGNSQMVLEDPDAALDATLPFVHSVHAKDHVMVSAEDSPHNKLTVAGVPMGEGFLPLRRLTKRLLENGLRRVCFENVWAYSAFIRPHRTPLPGVVLGEGSFRYAQPPFDPQYLILDQSKFSGDDLVRMEKSALDRGTASFRNLLVELGCSLKAPAPA
jgi:sugar phosphate isomerase/epimerase